MLNKSLKRIEEVIKPSGRWISLEINQDVIYVDFEDIELGNPKFDDDMSLSIRFDENTFITFFYNNIWDIDFVSYYDNDNQTMCKSLSHKVKEFKFIDFEYLNILFKKYKKKKTISTNEKVDIFNIRNDFFLAFETNNIAIVICGNQMDFFTKNERIDDDILKELSNQWVSYCLDYHENRDAYKEDFMCDKY